MAIRVTLSEVCEVLDQLLDGKFSRGDAFNWAAERCLFPDEETLLVLEPKDRFEEIEEVLDWMTYIDLITSAFKDQLPEGEEIIHTEGPSLSENEVDVWFHSIDHIREVRQSLDTPGALWDVVDKME